jgi:CHAD domain-containing protein
VKNAKAALLIIAAPLRESKNLWRLRARALEAARRQLRTGNPEGVHDLRVALRRTSATASALGKKGLADRATELVRGLSASRQLEVDRQLLTRVAGLGLISPELAAGLDGQWEALSRKHSRKAGRVASGKDLKVLARKVSRHASEDHPHALPRLESARLRAEKSLAAPPPDASDAELHRWRLAVKRARYLAEDLAAIGAPGQLETIAREKDLQESLGRWNDLRLFRKRLGEMRRDAERRGAVTLVSELDRVLSVLGTSLVAQRKTALTAARVRARVVSLPRRERTEDQSSPRG